MKKRKNLSQKINEMLELGKIKDIQKVIGVNLKKEYADVMDFSKVVY